MIKDGFWILVIILSIISQWDIIENQGRKPNHLLWWLIRIGLFLGFMIWYYVDEVPLYWVAPWMVAFFAFWFPVGLNAFRGKHTTYISPTGSNYDKVLLWIFREEKIVWYFWLMMMIISTALYVGYVHIEFTTFKELWN